MNQFDVVTKIPALSYYGEPYDRVQVGATKPTLAELHAMFAASARAERDRRALYSGTGQVVSESWFTREATLREVEREAGW